MKYWFFYIRIPKEDTETIPIIDVISLLQELDESEDESFYYGLYAWTSSKETAMLFKESRNPKYFSSKKMDIEEETTEWEALHSTYHKYEIIRIGYSDDNDTHYAIPMTRFESDAICDNLSAVTEQIINQAIRERNIIRKTDESFLAVLDIFDRELLTALDLFGWSEFVIAYGFLDCELSMLGHSGEDPAYLVEAFSDMSSYGLGCISEKKMEPYELDPVSSYIFMLGELLNEG